MSDLMDVAGAVGIVGLVMMFAHPKSPGPDIIRKLGALFQSAAAGTFLAPVLPKVGSTGGTGTIPGTNTPRGGTVTVDGGDRLCTYQIDQATGDVLMTGVTCVDKGSGSPVPPRTGFSCTPPAVPVQDSVGNMVCCLPDRIGKGCP